ncbi:unnamed protein product [Cuscuta campestris]|uniref:DUF4283 domain-containing protein n=1 Tax=Cuscuta campestris TaxID=132261 RepID=A0A484NBK4_9ASTE|nr:unnamed protein product [Cuscuta campestris]
MAGGRPGTRSHRLPDVKTITKHPNITGNSAGIRRAEDGGSPSTAHFVPATTFSDEAPNSFQQIPDVNTKPTPLESRILVAGISRSPSRSGMVVSGGLEQNPVTTDQIDVEEHHQILSGISAHLKESSIAAFDGDLKKPPNLDSKVFPSLKSSIRAVQGQIVKKELDIRDPHAKPVRLALVPPDSALVNFPATVTGAPAAAAATGQFPETPAPPPDSKKHTPSLAQVVSASNRIKVPTSITELLPDREVTVYPGMPAFRFMQSEVSQLALIDKYILVGKFSHGQPKLEVIKHYFSTHYVFRGSISVGLMIIVCPIIRRF